MCTLPGLEDLEVIGGTKLCGECKQELPLSEFGRDGGKSGYPRFRCRSCDRKHQNALNKIKKTAPPVPDNHCCPICGDNEEGIKARNPERGKRVAAWACDHDAKTERFRGWLCQKCNLALGNLNDDVERLKNAIKYLTESK